MVQPGTGNVVALAQDREWGTKGIGKTTYNYAVNSADGGTIGMQAGSVFKAFTLGAALEKGLDPYEYIDAPQTKTFAAGDWGCGEKFNQPAYTVNNSTGEGSFNMASATALSINTYFVELERQAGLCRTVDVAERLGVTLANGKRVPRYPSFTLGSMEVSPLTVAAAYAGLANHGVFCKPHAVTSISSLDGGAPMFTDNGQCRQALSRDVADGVTALLSGVIDGDESGRTGKKMSLGRDAAGKTGTTDTSAAVWFAGYTPDLAAAVWAGDPRGGFKYPMSEVTINGEYYDEVHGSSIPGPIWREAMLGALAESEAQDFDLEATDDLKAARGSSSHSRKDDGYYYNYYYRSYGR
jgi:membrane peptidoglycan carboxypeptidase